MESVERNKQNPELFRNIVSAAKKTSKEIDNRIHAGDNPDYEAAYAEYEKIYGEKIVDARSVRNRLRQKELTIKERWTGCNRQCLLDYWHTFTLWVHGFRNLSSKCDDHQSVCMACPLVPPPLYPQVKHLSGDSVSICP